MAKFTDWWVTVERQDGQVFSFVNQGDRIEEAVANARLWTSSRIVGVKLWHGDETADPATQKEEE